MAKKEKLLNVGYDDVLSLTDPKLEENIMDLINLKVGVVVLDIKVVL